MILHILLILTMLKLLVRNRGKNGEGRVPLWLMSSYFTLITAPAVKAFLRLAQGP